MNDLHLHVAAVIHRASVMTLDEASLLAGLWRHSDARSAAYRAAVTVSNSLGVLPATAGWDAKLAVGDAVGHGHASHWASVIAGQTSEAVLARHLIGRNANGVIGWDRAAYDLLTAEWASVIGPAHPED